GPNAVHLAVAVRDRTSPMTLPRDEPVAQPVLDGPAALALGLERLHDSLAARLRVQAVVLAAVDHRAGTHVRLAKLTLRACRWGDHLAERQSVWQCRSEVPPVVRRHCHDRAGAV